MIEKSYPFPDFLIWETYRFAIQAIGPIKLPVYKGGTFRGGMLTIFRRIVCAAPHQRCRSCLLSSRCLYAQLFETRLPDDHPDARKYKKPPRPYVLNPPITERRFFEKNDILEFSLILFGQARNALPYFIYTFKELGKAGLGSSRGKFDLLRVDRTTNGRPLRIYDMETQTISSAPENETEMMISIPADDLVNLEFQTPLRIKADKSLVTRLTFPVFFENLCRRISLMTGIYGDPARLPDLAALEKKAAEVITIQNGLRWYDWDRYSGRQKTRMQFGGLVGGIGFEGDLDPFMPLIAVGEQINIGQLTTFGLGKYQIKSR